MNGIKYPVKVKDITKFEKQNCPEVSVNLFGYEENKVYLLRSSEDIKTRHLNLLYITEGENGHYTLTKDLSKLVSSQYTKSNGRLYICPYCLNSCKTQIILDNYRDVNIMEHKEYIYHQIRDAKIFLFILSFMLLSHRFRFSIMIIN